MSPNHNPVSDEQLDRHIAALRDQPVPADGPSPQAVDATLAMLRRSGQVVVTGRRPFYERIVAMTMTQRIAAVVMLTLGGLVLYTIFALFNTLAPSVAFADVADKFKTARTLIFNSTTTLPGGKPPVVTRVLVSEGNRMRHEMPGGMVSIISGQTALTLFPQTKTAIRTELNRAPGENQGPDAKADVVQALRELGKAPGEPIGAKTIDGKPAVGFRSKVGNHLMTVWADKETAMPVRVEMALKWGEGEAQVVMDQFQIDQPLDEALFSVEPPPGYRLTTERFEMPSPKNVEEAVIEYLRESAQLNDGMFLPSLQDVAAFVKATKAGDQKTQRRLAMLMGTVTAMTSGVEHGYAGKGVRLGEKDKVVFWYRKAGEPPAYRAVFGDLRAEDVAADKLPATRPAK